MSDGKAYLRVLGGVELLAPDGRSVRSVLAQPKRLALLIYLAAAGRIGLHRKDTLLALFWPDADDRHARQALKGAVYFLRHGLDQRVVVTAGDDEVGVDKERLDCDAVLFDRALDSGATEAALDLYRGELAPGFLVSGLPGFERWLEMERTRLRERAVRAAVGLAERDEELGQLASAERWARRATVLSPFDERAARLRMRLLDRLGDRAGAIRTFGEFSQRLRDDLEVEVSPETQALITAVRSRHDSRAPLASTEAVLAPRGAEPAGRFTAAPAAQPVPVPRRDPPRAALLGALATVTLGWVLAAKLTSRSGAVLTTARAVPITSESGIEFQPALSPDGSLVAFTTYSGGRMVVKVRSAAGAPGSGEISPAESDSEKQLLPSWSRDGEFVRYATPTVQTENLSAVTWREVSRLGGAVQLVNLPPQARWTAWARDGAGAVFGVRDSIFVYDSTRNVSRLLAVHAGGWEPHSFAWSPDGRWIAYVNGNPFWPVGRNTAPASVWLVASKNGERVPVTNEDHLNVSPAWLDARHLLFVSDRHGRREVYAVEITEEGTKGEAVMVPGGTDAHSISISADGKRLALAKFVARQNVRSFPLDGTFPVAARDGRPATTGSQVVETHDVSPDGQWLVYDTDLHGDADIYLKRLDGGTPIPLVTGPTTAFFPRWSPDGHEIAFSGGVGNDVWVMPAAGGTPTRLTAAPVSGEIPIWSPDGLHLAFRSGHTGRPEAWVVSREAIGGPWGQPRQLTDSGCAFQVWATDGSGLICSMPGQTVLTLVALSGAVLWRRDLARTGLTGLGAPVFSDDGTTMYLRGKRGGHGGLWALPTSGGDPRLVVPFDDPSLTVMTYPGTINVSHGRLYLTVGEFESDIWVMDLEWH